VIFTNTVNIPGPDLFQNGLTFADFNNDGKLDALFSNDHNATVSLSLGDGNGGFGPTTEFVVYDHPWGATSADFNGDGNMDFAVTSPPSGFIETRFGDGAGGFGPITPAFSWYTSSQVVQYLLAIFDRVSPGWTT
jgi:hypothetical protein